MPVTIRTHDGEMSYQGLDEVRQALTNGLVDPTDQIRVSETEPWRPVSEVAGAPARWQWRDHFYWYIAAALLLLKLAGWAFS